MRSTAEGGSLARAAARDLIGDRWRIARACVILLLVPLSASVVVFGVMFATLLVNPMHTDVLSWDAYRTLSEYVMPLAFVLALSAFAVLDAIFVSTLADDGGFQTGYRRVRENPRGVALWSAAFVIAFWPFRLVVWPHWTFAWLLEALSVLSGDMDWLPLPAVARAVGAVLVLSTVTLYLAPLAVVDPRSPGLMLRRQFRLVREIPVETAWAALLGLASVLAGFLAFGLGLLALSFSLGLWIFGLLLLPVTIPLATLGFVCLAAAYAFARTLVVETYRRRESRLPNDAGASHTNAPADLT